jgi:hypothetical protein
LEFLISVLLPNRSGAIEPIEPAHVFGRVYAMRKDGVHDA